MTTTYRVLTQHTGGRTGRRTSRRNFDTWDEASAAAEQTTPDTDGTMFPNVESRELDRAIRNQDRLEDETFHGAIYSSGKFWNGNRYAVILRVTK